VTRKRTAAPVLYVAEPSPAFVRRPSIVVDCSVLSAALFEEETREEAVRILGGRAMHAPVLLDSEMVSVAAKKKRAGVADALIDRALSAYSRQDIEFHRPDVLAQYGLALAYSVSTYDAAYLWVAGLLRVPLATFDEKLAKAANAYLANLGLP
jgi:predicted nucleic acid-binding protein